MTDNKIIIDGKEIQCTPSSVSFESEGFVEHVCPSIVYTKKTINCKQKILCKEVTEEWLRHVIANYDELVEAKKIIIDTDIIPDHISQNELTHDGTLMFTEENIVTAIKLMLSNFCSVKKESPLKLCIKNIIIESEPALVREGCPGEKQTIIISYRWDVIMHDGRVLRGWRDREDYLKNGILTTRRLIVDKYNIFDFSESVKIYDRINIDINNTNDKYKLGALVKIKAHIEKRLNDIISVLNASSDTKLRNNPAYLAWAEKVIKKLQSKGN